MQCLQSCDFKTILQQKSIGAFILLTPEVPRSNSGRLDTGVEKRWLLRRQRRVLPPACVRITPRSAPFWSGTERCWTCRSSPSPSWSDTSGTRRQVRPAKPSATASVEEARRCAELTGTSALCVIVRSSASSPLTSNSQRPAAATRSGKHAPRQKTSIRSLNGRIRRGFLSLSSFSSFE